MKCIQPKGLGANTTPVLLAGMAANSGNFVEGVVSRQRISR